ncbi:UNVERIFIED_CONTAM: hypothetical protein GTU68_008266 [Idotea baltica]|nr:hypothetical protein [Idotea baltica]
MLDVARIIPHEDFNAVTRRNDIALLALATPFSLGDFVQPIPLPAPLQNTTGDCVLTGWGDVAEDGPNPDVLQKLTLPVISDQECRQDYLSLEIADSMICAGVPEGGKDACQGDSGGPLACQGYLGGIVSWGEGCAEPGYPGVYTEVAYFVDWIEANAI